MSPRSRKYKVTGYQQANQVINLAKEDRDRAEAPAKAILKNCQTQCENEYEDNKRRGVSNAREIFERCWEKCAEDYCLATQEFEEQFEVTLLAIEEQQKKFHLAQVFIVDSHLLPLVRYINSRAGIKPVYYQVKNFEDLSAALGRDVAVDQLTFFLDGSNGAFVIRHVRRELDELAQTWANTVRLSAQGPIYFEGCNIGGGTAGVITFQKLIDGGLDFLSYAWNYWHVYDWVQVSVRGGTLAERISRLRKRLAYAHGYFVAGEPSIEELAAKPSTKRRVLVEWFQEPTPIEQDLPNPQTPQTRKMFKQRSEAKDVTIRGPAAAKQYDQHYLSTPVRPDLERLEIHPQRP